MTKRVKTTDEVATLLNLPEKLLAKCLEPLEMIELLRVSLCCRRLQGIANGRILPLRVMTWNIRWKGGETKQGGWDWEDRLPVLDGVIEREDPDILLLQEDTAEMTAEMTAGTRSFQKYHSFPRDVNGMIPEIFGETKFFHHRFNHELCGILWRKNLFEYIDGGQFEWKGSRNEWVNVFTWVLLKGKTRLLVCNTHLECGLGQIEKQNNSKMLRQAIGRLQKRFEGVPVLLGGDFNTDKSGFDYKVLTGKELHTFQLGGDKQQDLVDVFTALDEDKPDTRFEPLFDNIRTGGHNGTTYNLWKEGEHAVNVSNHKNSKAKGHERHIDHIYIGNICRDAIRVSDARVITNSSSEDIRKKGSSPCFCGALKKCKKAWSAKAKELCTCRHFGIFGSDHFPIVANLSLVFNS